VFCPTPKTSTCSHICNKSIIPTKPDDGEPLPTYCKPRTSSRRSFMPRKYSPIASTPCRVYAKRPSDGSLDTRGVGERTRGQEVGYGDEKVANRDT
jgi:hypothetical protein